MPLQISVIFGKGHPPLQGKKQGVKLLGLISVKLVANYPWEIRIQFCWSEEPYFCCYLSKRIVLPKLVHYKVRWPWWCARCDPWIGSSCPYFKELDIVFRFWSFCRPSVVCSKSKDPFLIFVRMTVPGESQVLPVCQGQISGLKSQSQNRFFAQTPQRLSNFTLVGKRK